MKLKRDIDGDISVINYSNQFFTVLNPSQNISVVSIKKDFEFSYKLPPECCDDYPTKYHLTPLVSNDSISKFVFSKKNHLYILNAGEELTVYNVIKSRATILSVISCRLVNSYDWNIITLTAHEKTFRLELRLSKNLEIIETLNLLSFEDHIELLDIQFVDEYIFHDNFGIIIIIYRIKDDIKYALISVISKKFAILRHNSLNDKLKMNVDNVFSCYRCWFFCEKSNLARATLDHKLLDLTFERFFDFNGNFFISHEIWGKYNSTSDSVNIKLFKWPKFELLNETFSTDDKITNIFGGIDGNNVLLLLIYSKNERYQTISLNTDNFNRISSAFQFEKAIRSFDNNVNYLNLDKDFNITNVRNLFQLETLRDEDAVKILLKDPELLLPVFIESFNISPIHLIMAFKKHLNQKSFDILIRMLLKWLDSFNNGVELTELSSNVYCNFDPIIWIKKVVELTCCILDSTVNSSFNADKIVTEELIRLTKDVCKLQKNLQHIYSRVTMLTSASYFHDVRKYNSNKLLETFSIDL